MSVMRQLAKETTEYVLMESTRRSIERWAEEFAQELREDPIWRAKIKAAAHEYALAMARQMDAEDEAEARKAHSGRKRSPRKTKRRRPGTRTSRTS